MPSDTLVRSVGQTSETFSLLYLNFNVSGAMLEAARECETEVFLKAFGNTREQLDEEYGPYEDQSVFLTVSDADNLVFGSCRIITPGAAGFKSLNDLRDHPWGIDGERSARAAGADLESTWDIATIGVRDTYRGARLQVALALYHGITRAGRTNGIRTLISILDEPVRRALGALDYHHVTLPGTHSAPYLGSRSSTPVYYHASMLDAQRRTNPDSYRMVIQGKGLEGISIPDDAAFLLPGSVAPPATPDEAAA